MRTLRFANGLVGSALALACSSTAVDAPSEARTITTNPINSAGQAGLSGAGGGSGSDAPAELGFEKPDRAAPELPTECQPLSIPFANIIPNVILLVDRSGSMFGAARATRWDPLEQALMDPLAGVVPKLESKARFGFAAYTSQGATCPNLLSVPLALDNAASIQAEYTRAGEQQGGGTPTGESLRAVTQTLVAAPEEGPKFILIVTDGNPDTCAVDNPQCGADDTIAAAQAAYAQGISTWIVGLGEIGDDDCEGRCGNDHLQDVANAGVGLPVTPNTPEYAISDCVIASQGLQATYADATQAPGAAPFYTAATKDELAAAILKLVLSARSCTFELDATIDLTKASEGTVTLDDEPLIFEDPNGWRLVNDTTLEVQGTACEKIKAGSESLDIKFPCDVAVIIR